MERRIGGGKQQVQALTREGREEGEGRKCMGRYSRSRATGDIRGGWHTPRAEDRGSQAGGAGVMRKAKWVGRCI